MSALDEDLLEAWRTGDGEAGSALLERYFMPLYNFFRNKVEHGTDDLIQQTMLACVAARDRVRDAPNFRAFVFTIARRQLFAHFRRRGLEQKLEAKASVHELGTTPSDRFAVQRQHKLLLRGLRRIPLDHQLALELFYWEELTGPELAGVLGVPEGTVRTRLRRARQLLLEAMEEIADSPEVLESTRANLDSWARSLREHLQQGDGGGQRETD